MTPNTPVLRSLRGLQSRHDLAAVLGIPLQTLTYMVYVRRPESYYRTWDIKKKNGRGVRRISAPTSTLLDIQRVLNRLLQAEYQPRPSVHGYVQARDVTTNATMHLGSGFVLNLDLKDFFPSIHLGRVIGLFRANPFGCSREVATTLAQLCCHQGGLPVGAPTSPVISNMICRRLDKELQELARRFVCRYSRYADDLTISCTRPRFPKALASQDDNGRIALGTDLLRIIESNTFAINEEKTRLSSSRQRQIVTGVKVNSKLNVDRRYVRRIRGMLYALNEHGSNGAQAHVARHYKKDRFQGKVPQFEEVLRGRIAYLAMIRGPGDPLVQRFSDQMDNLLAGRDLNAGIDYRPPVVGDRLHGAEPGRRRQLSTVMFTDMEKSTQRLAAVGDNVGSQVMEQHMRLLRKHVRRQRGRVVNPTGDGVVAIFANPSDAVRAANRILTEAETEGIGVRAGVHTGEIELVGDDISGLAVNLCARIMGKAKGGQILVSNTTRDLVAGSGFEFKRSRHRKLKGIPERIRLFSLMEIPRNPLGKG